MTTKTDILKTANVWFALALTFIMMVSCNKNKNDAVADEAPVTIAVGIGKVVPEGGVSNLASPVAGIVSQINVSVGDSISKGTTLIVLNNNDASLSLDEIVSRYNTQLQNIESTKLKLKQGQIKINDIERRLTDQRELLMAGAVSAESVRLLENELNIEKQQFDILSNDVNIQRSGLGEIKSQRETKKSNLDNTSLKSPIDGIVLDIIPHVGESVNIYDSYLKIAPFGQLIVSAEIDEMFSDRIKIGQNCQIYVSGQADPIAEGKVIRISPDLKQKSLFSDSGQDFQDRRVRLIDVSINNDIDILIDTKVECIIQLD